MRFRARAAIRRAAIKGVALLLPAMMTAACGEGLFRQYEYEEDVYLSLDGSATVYVNTSIQALNALRGTSFDPSPGALFDRPGFARFFGSPAAHVVWVRSSRRSGRRFVHVRLEVDDVNRLGATAPFAWSTYRFGREGELFVYRQAVGRSSGGAADAGWNGRELVAFRLHLPSKIVYHNTLPDNLRRGNILVWEQPLADRLRGVPVALDARMETQSILNRTLALFGATLVAVAVTFGLVILWVTRRTEPSSP